MFITTLKSRSGMFSIFFRLHAAHDGHIGFGHDVAGGADGGGPASLEHAVDGVLRE